MFEIKRQGVRFIGFRRLTGLSLAMSLVIVVMAGCGGPPDGVVSEADEAATTRVAERAGFKYCNIVSDRFCQSPDGELVFHLPVEVLTATDGNRVSENLMVSNNGPDEVVIEEYYMMIVDDRGNSYRPVVHGPAADKKIRLIAGAPQSEESHNHRE